MTIPVLLLTFNRPDYLRKRLSELLQQEETEIVVVSVDYASDELLAKNLDVVKEFQSSHKSDLRVVLRTKNLGIAHHLPLAVSEVLEEFNYVIVIEDDIRIGRGALKHFKEAKSLLESDSKVLTIGGFGPTIWLFSRFRRNKWRESIYFSAWGWMTSKSSWEHYRTNLPNEMSVGSLFENENVFELKSQQKRKWERRFERIEKNPNFTWDIQVQYWTFRLGMKHLLPTMRILENQGFFDSRSINTVNARPRWMGKERVYESSRKMKTSGSGVSRFYCYLDSFTIGGDREIARIKKILSLLTISSRRGVTF